MTFTPGIPSVGQSLGSSRLQVLNNFASLRSTISNVTQPNHADVNSTGPGKHFFVQMPVQTEGPANLPLVNEGGLITKTVTNLVETSSELFYVRDNTPIYFQVTGPLFTGQGPSTTGGTTMLFGGIILKWGNAPTAAPYTFATLCGSQFPNSCFMIVGLVGIDGLSATGFTTSVDFGNFIAIGN